MQTYMAPAAFLDRAQPILEAEAATNNLILGITIRLRERPEWMDTRPYLATVDGANGDLALAAVMTPQNNLVLAAGGAPGIPAPNAKDLLPSALDELAEDLLTHGWQVPGVTGEIQLAERFAQAWTRRTGQPLQIQMRMRAYELRQVIPPSHPPTGFLRPATLEDLEISVRWRAAFQQESLHEAVPDDLRAQVIRHIESGSVYLWDDNGPVSTAASNRPTQHGISIGGVYTPLEMRGHGYASALVAALSQQMLDSGKTFCTLFTDLDYPTSNSIYQKIGYHALCDFAVIHFGF